MGAERPVGGGKHCSGEGACWMCGSQCWVEPCIGMGNSPGAGGHYQQRGEGRPEEAKRERGEGPHFAVRQESGVSGGRWQNLGPPPHPGN